LLKKYNFWQFFDIQMAIFHRVNFTPTVDHEKTLRSEKILNYVDENELSYLNRMMKRTNSHVQQIFYLSFFMC